MCRAFIPLRQHTSAPTALNQDANRRGHCVCDTMRRTSIDRIRDPAHVHAPARSGFTFFEIAISISIAAFCLLTVMAIIPAGLKVQQKARFELLAATKDMELIDLFSSKPSEERAADFETDEPWDARPWCYSSTRWDLETRLARWDNGIIPVPPTIAQRLQSNNDEIHSILSQGGNLYYADAMLVPSIDPAFVNPEPANESLKLVFAVTGYAQNNAIPVFSYKAWPYRAAYPSPPMVCLMDGYGMFKALNFDYSLGGANPFETWSIGTPEALAPTLNQDPLMTAISLRSWIYAPSSAANYPTTANTDPTNLGAMRQNLQTAVFNYITDRFTNGGISNPLGNLPISNLAAADEYTHYYLAANEPDSDFMALGQQYDADFNALCSMAEALPGESYAQQSSGANNKAKLRSELGLRVTCMRFLSMVMSTYYIYNRGMDASPPDLSQIPQANLLPLTDPLTLNRLRYYHDRSIQFAMRYAASFTYDWGAPRPYNRCIMTDYPLFEYDMFSPTHKGTISGTGGMPAEQWCPISAQTITTIGLPQLYPGILKNDVWDNTSSPFVPFDGLTRKPNPPNIWGDASHFTLTKPFKPAERCRQLVFWAVDWQSYEDAETTPSAPMDASKCPLDGTSGYYLSPGGYQLRLNNYIPYSDGLFYRNPERQLNFIEDISQLPSGTNVAQDLEIGRALDTAGPRPFNTNYAPASVADSGLPILNGVYGADRNHNYILDRGPIKKSTHLMATLVARFNFYDPRLPITTR